MELAGEKVVREASGLRRLKTNPASEGNWVSRFFLIFPYLFISILLAPMMAAALIHLLSYVYSVPVNFFSSLFFLIVGTGISFRIMLNFQQSNPSRIVIRKQYATLLGMFVGLLPVFSALKLASSTIWEQRFNWLYFSNEDTAAWVSAARATLQNGHLPEGTSDSEYSLYGSASVLPGVILRILTSGKTASSHYDAVLMGTDAVLFSYLYTAIVAVSLVAAFLFIMPKSIDLPKPNNFISILILTTSISLASSSLFVAIPIAQGSFLGLSWAIIGTFASMFFTYIALESKRINIGILLAIFMVSNFAVSIWPYLEIVYIIVSILFLMLTLTDENLSIQIKLGLPAALIFGGVLGALKPFLDITKDNTFITLSSAQGLIIERDQLLIILAILGATYLVFALKDKHDTNPAIPAFVVGALFAAAVVTFSTRQNGILGEYGIAKLQYIGIVIATISGLLYFANQISNLENFAVSLFLSLTIFSAVNFSTQLSAITVWPSSFSVGAIGPPGDVLKRQIKVMSESNLSCIPKNDDSREKAYKCNRWASALSSTNSDLDFQFRAALLNDPRDMKVIVEEFWERNFFYDRLPIPMAKLFGIDTK